MVRRELARRARAVLDARLGQLGAPARYQPPHRGWIRAIRDALGMSAADLGRRLGVTGPAVSALERSEQDGTARLDTLRRAAAAMDCTLVYALIPNHQLEESVRARAELVARRQLQSVATTMALEDQAVRIDEGLLRAQTQRLLESGRIWSD
jgi:predicted DNA-binding mobile mystery protein A